MFFGSVSGVKNRSKSTELATPPATLGQGTVSSIIPIIFHTRRETMAESVYKVIELIGTSTESWERAATVAVERASQSLRDLRVAEVVQLDMVIDEGKVTAYRAKLKVSFKYESGG
jgi:dodecin